MEVMSLARLCAKGWDSDSDQAVLPQWMDLPSSREIPNKNAQKS